MNTAMFVNDALPVVIQHPSCSDLMALKRDRHRIRVVQQPIVQIQAPEIAERQSST